MRRQLCIHGHFYQPPRLDPWLETVLPEGSAAPEHDWNARITKECYAPLAWARRLDSSGKIQELVNCYEWISFNFGPTLLSWLENNACETYARILAADKASLNRLGHGNALAQVYHHAIMPLATDLDKDLEILWAVQDFRFRFGRDPEGMWLAETAVDIPTLSALARAGIMFTILAPRQAHSVRLAGSREFHNIDESTLDTTRPYLVELPDNQQICVFFYDGPTSRAVAFERLLENGENFWNRLSANTAGLCNIATDGESYGHHFMFGEMALAYAIEQARQGRNDITLTNYAAYLAAHPARDEVRIHENSSWSCVHGLERWKTHCGCADGGHPDWIQDWRRPLRRCLNYLKYYVDEHYFKLAPTFVADPLAALNEYGQVLCGAETLDAFLAKHEATNLALSDRQQLCRLLTMQRFCLASFASCAWFFDDIARIEPLNSLTCARRALDLLQAADGPDIEAGFITILEEAHSNMPEELCGAAIWQTMVTPRRPSLQELGAYLRLPGEVNRASWPGLELERITNTLGSILRARWTRTLEEAQESETASSVFADHSRHRMEIGFRLSRHNDHTVMDASCHTAVALAPLLDALTEGQSMPQARLALQIPGLVWAFAVENTPLQRDVLIFISSWLGANQDIRRSVEADIEDHGLQLAKNLPENANQLSGLISRTRQIGLIVHWWEVQNIVFSMQHRGLFADLCQLLNIGTTL